ncbi:MAG: hypothetical protein QNJ51_16475 [Calothrix sp. MO_167.B12]|nr:hypothetical protein [Calothrix sp. MO_167.B12]
MIQLGDWVYPNAHPIFHGKLEPIAAVEWTKQAYKNIKRRSGSNRFVIFKEVGLPTAGDSQNRLSEKSQEQYYLYLATKTDVSFTWFEGFDQIWKNNPPFEQHWGIFHSDRTPKRLASSLPWRNK